MLYTNATLLVGKEVRAMFNLSTALRLAEM